MTAHDWQMTAFHARGRLSSSRKKNLLPSGAFLLYLHHPRRGHSHQPDPSKDDHHENRHHGAAAIRQEDVIHAASPATRPRPHGLKGKTRSPALRRSWTRASTGSRRCTVLGKRPGARTTVELIPPLEENVVKEGSVFRDIAGTDALCLVARDFTDDSVYHVKGSVDAPRDIDTVMGELLLHDLLLVEKRLGAHRGGEEAEPGRARGEGRAGPSRACANTWTGTCPCAPWLSRTRSGSSWPAIRSSP